jgi:hypothetical protein
MPVGTPGFKPTLTPSAPRQLVAASPLSMLQLPTELSVPSANLRDYVLLIYGEKKIGKTSLCARFPNTLFLMFEPGTKALRILGMAVPSWETFIKIIDLLHSDAGQRYDTVVVDTVDIAYELCQSYVCTKAGVDHPHDANDFGKTWQAITQEFTKQMGRLLNLGKGVIVLSHGEEVNIPTRTQGTYCKIMPTMATKAAKYFAGIADVIAYYGYYDTVRYLVIAGSDYIQAGSRVEENFRTVDGRRISAIPMGTSADEAYENILLAFDNKQVDPCDHVSGVPTLSDPTVALKPTPEKRK